MLIPLQPQDFEATVNWAYSLAIQPATSSYPAYYDTIKTKQDFIARSKLAFSRDNEEILLFRYNNTLEGWIHYYVLHDNHYLSLCSCCIHQFTQHALQEFLDYIKKHFSGYQCMLVFPSENTQAVSFLTEAGFELIESSFHDVICLDNITPQVKNENIISITHDNFDAFRKVHDNQSDMYWNSDRLYADLANWHLYVYGTPQNPLGAICFTDEQIMYEIFSVDFIDQCFHEDIYNALVVKALYEAKRMGGHSLTFFNDQKSQPYALALGFQYISTPLTFEKVL